MVVIENKVVSRDLFTVKFICDLNKCKGACCWEGDFGAPVKSEEIQIIESILPIIFSYLSEESVHKIRREGVAPFSGLFGDNVTPLHEDGACAFLIRDKLGVAQCAFEKAFEDKKTTFRKPISCHLYPMRIHVNNETGFEALNYDRWDICSAACTLGEKYQMPVFRFLKEAIVRKYGQEFYDQMEVIYRDHLASD